MCLAIHQLQQFGSTDPFDSINITSDADQLSEEALEAIYLRLLTACDSGSWDTPSKMNKVCLVTTGATAAFPELVKAALLPESLQAFADNGFTKLIFQCGATFTSFNEMMPIDLKGLNIEAFDFKAAGLNREMRECQAKDGVSKKGLLICHAGRLLQY